MQRTEAANAARFERQMYNPPETLTTLPVM